MRRTTCTLLIALAGCASAPDDSDAPEPSVPCARISRNTLDFEPTTLAEAREQPKVEVVELHNACAGELAVGTPYVFAQGGQEDDVGLFSSQPPSPATLGEGESTTVAVRYAPTRPGEHRARLQIPTNDPEVGNLWVDLRGEATGPVLVVTPERLDLGAHTIGCTQTSQITLSNIGNAPLEVTSADLVPRIEEARLDTDPPTNGELPITLAPYDAGTQGPTLDVFLEYTPLDAEWDEVSIEFRSSDPYRPTAVITAWGTGVVEEHVIERWEQPPALLADVLVIWDRTLSADLEGRALDNMERVVTDVMASAGDVHLAAVVAEDGCILGDVRTLRAGETTPAPWPAFETMLDLDEVLDTPTSTEFAALATLEAALSPTNTGTGGCNADFFRPDAKLVALLVSATADSSPEPWNAYVGAVEATKEASGATRIHAIAGDYPHGCADASPGAGLFESTVATGGTYASICSVDWYRRLTGIPEDMSTARERRELSQPAVSGTIEVYVDGVLLTSGWSYELPSNSLIFDEGTVPATGAQVEVRYHRLAECPER